MTANLLSRLQGLTAPDREVDARIAVAVGDVIMRHSDAHGYAFFHAPIVKGDRAFLSNCQDGEADAFESLGRIGVKRYTASLDAAIALCERVLPGYDWVVAHTNGGLTIHAQVGQNEMVFGETPAIALLIAILTALEARENG
jgi:hypothetical protein